jgi:superfamily II DNA or RNA helicase
MPLLAAQYGPQIRFALVRDISPDFLYACRAMEIRGLLRYGTNPILVRERNYQAFYFDASEATQDVFDRYAWLVYSYLSDDFRIFIQFFPGLSHEIRPPFVDPSRADGGIDGSRVEVLLAQYENTSTPLTFYGKPFPAEGVIAGLQCVENRNAKGVYIAFSPGMGKTRIALIGAGMAKEVNAGPILVIGPKTALATAWPSEMKKLGIPESTGLVLHHSDDIETVDHAKRFHFIQWETLIRMPAEFFIRHPYRLIIADEVHLASNQGSQRGRCLETLINSPLKPKLWGFTGTMIRKRPSDMLHLLAMVGHPLICKPDGARDEIKAATFLARYCGEYNERQKRWDFRNPRNLDEFNALIRDVVVVREKEETALPEQWFIPVVADFSHEDYAAIEEMWHDYLADPIKGIAYQRLTGKRKADVQLGIRRRACAERMIAHTQRFAERILAKGRKIIIFTAYRSPYQKMVEYFRQRGYGVVGIDGSTPTEARTSAEHRFQTDPSIRVFVGNEKAAGVALTLTASTDSIFSDLGWTTSTTEQAAGRNNRGGSTAASRNWMLFAAKTVSETQLKDFRRHQHVAQRALGRRKANGESVRKILWARSVDADQDDLF